jgi:voltage-gated potassium channel
MLVLSLIFLVVLVFPEVDRHMSQGTRTALDTLDWSLWAAFAVEYLALLLTAPDRRHFVRTHVVDLAVVVLPVLRPLRLVRSVRLLRLLRLTRLAAVVAGSVQKSRTAFFSRAVAFAVSVGFLVVVGASVLVLDLERDQPGANIRTFGDALWWAVTTATTVGYGDRYPVTGAGRAIAAGLMLVGLAIVGVVTAAIAAWLVTLTEQPADDQQERELVDLATLQRQLVTLQASVDELQRRLGDAPAREGRV